MRVDTYLLWILYAELSVLGFLFFPIGTGIKKAIVINLQPLFTRLQIVLWMVWTFVAFVFASTMYESWQNKGSSMLRTGESLSEMTTKLLTAEAQRDAMLSFACLLLFPIIRSHAKLLFRCFSLEQTEAALKRQAEGVSAFTKNLLEENSKLKKESKGRKKGDEEKKQSVSSEELEELQNRVDALETRLRLCTQSRDEYREKFEVANSELTKLRGDPQRHKKDT